MRVLKKPTYLILPLVFATVITGCSDEIGSAVQTVAAPAAATLVAQGGDVVATEVAQGQQTVEVAVATQSAGLQETVEAAVATSIPGSPPATPVLPNRPAFGTYQVVHGDNLSKVARQFATTVDQLVEWNRDWYPSLVVDPNEVEVGWILIVSAEPQAVPTTLPAPLPTPWSDTPGCDVSDLQWMASPIHCQESTIDVVSKIGFNLGCVALDGNPLGYYMEHKIYTGWILIDAEGIWSYGWFVDKEKHETVIGPSIITAQPTTLSECGIPGNP